MRSLDNSNEKNYIDSNYTSNRDGAPVNVMIMEDYSASPAKQTPGTPQDYMFNDKSTSFPALNNQTNNQFKESSKDTMTSLGLQGPEMEDLIMN